MSTCNFRTMDDFDLWVIDDEKICEWYLGEEIIEERKKENEDYEPIWDIEFAYDLFLEDFNRDSGIDELNDNLKWYNVRLLNGYYDGVQIYIDTEWSGIDEVTTWLDTKYLIWDDNECFLQFGLSRKETIKMIEEEKKRINTFLENLDMYGFYKIECVGRFNNGEAIYKLAK